jgi:hypothetical protein
MNPFSDTTAAIDRYQSIYVQKKVWMPTSYHTQNLIQNASNYKHRGYETLRRKQVQIFMILD